MVFYFTTVDPSYVVYVGRDKHENEDLIKHGWENDVWFHVDKVSIAFILPTSFLLSCAKHARVFARNLPFNSYDFVYYRVL